MIGPLFEKRGDMFKERANFETFDIDEDENDQIAIQYKIVKIPTIIVIINGKIVNCIDEHLSDQHLDIVINTYITKRIENINRLELLNTDVNTHDADTTVSSR
jgi:thioredoxin-like negative regulator of GroEL